MYLAGYMVSWSYDYYTGSGSGWTWQSTLSSSDFTAAYDAGEGCWVYEARILLTTLDDQDNFGASGETIGFAVSIDEDGSPGAECGWPTSADYTDPDTWGDLVYSPNVPEFSALLFPIIVMVAVPLILRKHWRGDVFD